MKPHVRKTRNDIASEWDRLVHLRARQIDEGVDLSLHHVLLPCIERLMKGTNRSTVLDVGCGSGYVSNWLAQRSRRVTGVDISRFSIDLAATRYSGVNNLDFVNQGIEEYDQLATEPRVSLVVANMFLMATMELDASLAAIAKLLRKGGHFIATLTHPWFWPAYWGYQAEQWFAYNEEIAIEAPFRISLEQETNLTSTHVHRSLGRYYESLRSAGFIIEELEEPMPSPTAEKHYPERWQYPRFLGLRCKK